MKRCTKCGITKPFESFSKKNKNKTTGLQPWCKTCNKEHKMAWLPRNKESVRWNRLWSVYRLREADWNRLLVEQDGTCAICSRPPIVVDHDHACCAAPPTCGKCVRGLLCQACNLLVGLVEQDRTRIDATIRYLH